MEITGLEPVPSFVANEVYLPIIPYPQIILYLYIFLFFHSFIVNILLKIQFFFTDSAVRNTQFAVHSSVKNFNNNQKVQKQKYF